MDTMKYLYDKGCAIYDSYAKSPPPSTKQDGIDEGALKKIRKWLCCDDEISPPLVSKNSNVNQSLASNLVSNEPLDKKSDVKNASQFSQPANDGTEVIAKKERKRKNPNHKDLTTTWDRMYSVVVDGVMMVMPRSMCKLCNESPVVFAERTTWEVAHVVSFKDGGEDNVDNYRPICRHCNRSMQSKHFKDYCREKYPSRYNQLVETFNL